jgi:hypothetical protein
VRELEMGRQDKDNVSARHVKWPPLDKNPNDQGYVELDPRVVNAGFDLTGYYIEAGLKSFSDYAKKMIEEYGHDVRPYLKSWYLSVRYYPGIDPSGMDNATQVDELAGSWDSCN